MSTPVARARLFAVLLILGAACGGGDNSTADDALRDNLTETLRQENAEHYAFGCVDLGGTVLSSDGYSPEIIAAGAEIEHEASSWVADTSVVILGDSGQRAIVIYDPASEATNIQEFLERDVEADAGTLTCFIPE